MVLGHTIMVKQSIKFQHMKNIIFICLVLGMISCSNDISGGYIIITNGKSMNPDLPRDGIELNYEGLYYCIERIGDIKKDSSVYDYYVDNEIDLKYLKYFKNNFIKEFKNYENFCQIEDGLPFQLIYNIDGESDTLTSFYSCLNRGQHNLIDSLFSLVKDDTAKIPFHAFPRELLDL